VRNPQEVLEELVFWENPCLKGFKYGFLPIKRSKEDIRIVEKLTFLDFS
jgi:hypothetical protein